MAGKIIAGAEQQGLLYAIDATGAFVTYSLGIAIEDIDMISANENFFGVNFGTGRLLGAPASEFAPYVDDILLTQEFHSGTGLFVLSWNGSTLVTTQLTSAPGSAPVGQWEHVTFAPAGIVEIPPVGAVPEPATIAIWSLLGVCFFGATKLRRSRR